MCWFRGLTMSCIRWEPPARRLPAPFDHYELGDYLGAGGMGVVWTVRSGEHLGEPLVMKFLLTPFCHTADGLEQFRDEARRGLHLAHQNIARTFAFLDLQAHTADGWPPAALVMARYDLSLQRVLDDARRRKEPVAPEVVSAVNRQVSAALYTLHVRYDIVHRDVKPSNILLRLRPGRAYSGPATLHGATALLADFGVACAAGSRPRFRLRQDGWKAPWLFGPDDVPADPAEDLHSYGLVLQALARAGKE
jgi:serine/threonine protein kinase